MLDTHTFANLTDHSERTYMYVTVPSRQLGKHIQSGLWACFGCACVVLLQRCTAVYTHRLPIEMKIVPSDYSHTGESETTPKHAPNTQGSQTASISLSSKVVVSPPFVLVPFIALIYSFKCVLPPLPRATAHQLQHARLVHDVYVSLSLHSNHPIHHH